ncbi:MAG: serine/threonine-protein kinase, partial [Planctomycetota bacterium]
MTREPGALSDLDDEAPTLITCAPLEAAPRARDRVSERLARAPGAESHPDDPLVGGVIDGRYKVLDRLGAGGMATVYKAWHLLLEKPVAIKFIRPEACRDEVFRQRFFREARVASQLVHPHAVAMREFGETPEGLFYLVMDLVSGRSLAQVLRQEGRLEPARAARLLGQILGALGEAHRLAIVHRDIKPDNVILTDDERVLVLDFGLAKIVGDPEGPAESRRGPPAAALDPSVTRSGMVLGTPRYMSPEQADGAACDHRTDLYSCGVLLYELLTGRPPFLARDVLGLIAQHLYEEPHPPSEVAPEAALPPALDAVVLRALAKRPDERWPSAQAFSEALDEALAASAPTLLELPILAPARPGPGAQEPGPRLGDGRARLTLAAAALVGMALAGGLAIRGRVGRFEPSSASREVWPEASPTGAPTEAALGSGSAAGAPPLRPTRAELGELAEVLSRSLAGAAAARRYAPELLERAEGLAREASGELASARDAASLAAVRERLRLSESLLGDARRAAAGALDAELRVLRPALERAEREAEAAGAAPGELRPR